MSRILKILAQVAGLGLAVVLISGLKPIQSVDRTITLSYNGLVWATSTTMTDVAGVLITNFGSYADWRVSPEPDTKLTDGMTIAITDNQTQKLNPVVAKNYQARQTEIKTPAKQPAPKPVAPKPTDVQSGLATWYRFGDKLTTASRKYPKGTKLRVVAVNSGQSVDVIVNDYGPNALTGIDLDLNVPAFKLIAPLGAGKIKVKYYKIP
jgi:rare lipoprotein A (peptidoglycan hydrolase)